jgi:GIY-YIG catalytic domain
MTPTQLRLLPAPQPLVERLGVEWFRSIPGQPGIYRFFDGNGTLLYVGKARSLRQRLSSYRRTHGQNDRITRLIHATQRIEWLVMADESSALLAEAESILRDQPRFNRAGRWRPPPLWARSTNHADRIQIQWINAPTEGASGPYSSARRGDVHRVGALLWLVAHPDAAISELPHSLSTPRSSESILLLPFGPRWSGMFEEWLVCQKPALLWEIAASLEPRMLGFNAAFIRDAWERVAFSTLKGFESLATG